LLGRNNSARAKHPPKLLPKRRPLRAEQLEKRELLAAFPVMYIPAKGALVSTATNSNVALKTLKDDTVYQLRATGTIVISGRDRMADAQYIQDNETRIYGRNANPLLRISGVETLDGQRFHWGNPTDLPTTSYDDRQFTTYVKGTGASLTANFQDGKPETNFAPAVNRLRLQITEIPKITVTAGTPAKEAGPVYKNFNIVRTGGDLSKPLNVNFNFEGDAKLYEDYTINTSTPRWSNPNGGFTISLPANTTTGANSSSASITIQPKEDWKYEPTEYVKLRILPSTGSTVAYTPPALACAMPIWNSNHAPVFSSSADNNIYEVKIGASTKTGALPVDTKNRTITSAEDPDSGDILTYTLVQGDPKYFSVHSKTGVVSIKVPAKDLPSKTFTLKVKVTDLGPLSSTAQVNGTVFSEAGIYGDTIAVEATNDPIKLTIRRFTAPGEPKPELIVKYRVNWQHINDTTDSKSAKLWDYEKFGIKLNATAADLILSSRLALLNGSAANEGFVKILAGHNEADLPEIFAEVDNLSEVLDRFSIEVLPDASHFTLVPPYKASPTIENYLRVEPKLELAIYDKVQRFSKMRGAIQNDFLSPVTGIDPNDIDQGRVGNCWVNAAMLRLAKENPLLIKNLFEDDATNKRYGVHLKLPTENGVVVRKPELARIDGVKPTTIWINYSDVFSRGLNAAMPSGDYDANGIEIWTILLERAITEAVDDGWGDGGLSNIAWIMLTGKSLREKAKPTLADINAMTNGQNAILSSSKAKTIILANGTEVDIVQPHAYVISKTGGKYYLYDPRIIGFKVEITNDLSKFFDGTIFQRVYYTEEQSPLPTVTP
jgi:Calpain family cysteine protease